MLYFCAVPPDCLLDRSLGSHEYVTANGIKFHYVTAGDRSKPLMLFLHGFPEVSIFSDMRELYSHLLDNNYYATVLVFMA